MTKKKIATWGSVVILALGVFVVLKGCGKPDDDKLFILSGGTMRPMVNGIAELYGADKCEVSFAGSGYCLTQIVTSKKGDIYVCHWPYGDIAKQKGVGDEVFYSKKLYLPYPARP